MSRPMYAVWHVLGVSERHLRDQLEHPEDIPFAGFVSSWSEVLKVAAETTRQVSVNWLQLPNGLLFAPYFRGAWAAWAAQPYLLEDPPGVALGVSVA